MHDTPTNLSKIESYRSNPKKYASAFIGLIIAGPDFSSTESEPREHSLLNTGPTTITATQDGVTFTFESTNEHFVACTEAFREWCAYHAFEMEYTVTQDRQGDIRIAHNDFIGFMRYVYPGKSETYIKAVASSIYEADDQLPAFRRSYDQQDPSAREAEHSISDAQITELTKQCTSAFYRASADSIKYLMLLAKSTPAERFRLIRNAKQGHAKIDGQLSNLIAKHGLLAAPPAAKATADGVEMHSPHGAPNASP